MDTRKKIIIAGVLMSPLVIAGCSDSESDSPSDSDVGVDGIYSLNVTGGLGGAKGGSGGDGNNISIYKAASTGDVEVLASGTADAGFTSIAPDVDLGSNSLDITTDITVDVFAEDAAEPAAGTPYLIEDNGRLFVSDGNASLGDEDPVTGISVASGVTLVLGLNYTTYAQISFDNDVFNSGIITTVDIDELHRGGLRIYPASYVGQTGSRIDTAGTLDMGSQRGGDVLISADYSIYNYGAVNTNGSDSINDDAVAAGYVELYADDLVHNTGDIDSSGGDAPNGDAGRGGNIDLASDFGNMYNSGSLVNHGGDGQLGGNGGKINLYAVGDMLNSGDINAQGGIGNADDGGDGDSIEMYAYGRKLVNSGRVLAMGGNTTDADSDGGDGGGLYVYAEYGPIDGAAPAGGLFVSGDIDLSGGDAVVTGDGDGGTAGSVDVQVYASNYPSEVRVAFLGYTDIDTTGGDANFGGSAGDVLISNDSVQANAGDVPSGNVSNEADVTARGGNVVAGAETIPADGGSGGNFRLETETQYGTRPELEIATNKGNVDVSGGNGLESIMTDINRSGSIWFWGYSGVTNTGNITANGGTDLGTDGGVTGYGGYANDVEMYTELGQVSNSGNITNNGGAGEYRGGRSDGFKLYGTTVNNSGVISSNGGNADASLEGSIGGSGGWVEFFSRGDFDDVTHSGSVSHTAGTGETTNDSGAFIRGACVSGDCRPE